MIILSTEQDPDNIASRTAVAELMELASVLVESSEPAVRELAKFLFLRCHLIITKDQRAYTYAADEMMVVMNELKAQHRDITALLPVTH